MPRRRAVAALGARLLGRGGDNLFEFGIEPDAGHAPARGLDARPLAERGAVHGRVMRQLGGLHHAAPRLLLGDVAGVDRRALGGVSPAFGRGEDRERLPGRPGRLVFLDQPGADHVIDAAPGGVGVAVKMLVGQVCVGHGAIEPHVGHRIARAFGPAAARPVARLGIVRAGVVFPPMAGGACLRVGRRAVAGPLLAGPVRARGSSVVRAGFARVRAGSVILAIPRILARPLGRAFLADAGKPGVVRLVVGALLRGPLGMLARAGGFLLKPREVVAGGFLRPVFTIPRRLVGRGAGVTGRAWSSFAWSSRAGVVAGVGSSSRQRRSERSNMGSA